MLAKVAGPIEETIVVARCRMHVAVLGTLRGIGLDCFLGPAATALATSSSR